MVIVQGSVSRFAFGQPLLKRVVFAARYIARKRPHLDHNGIWKKYPDCLGRGWLGNLDECNGAILGGEYVYIVTDAYPFYTRCLYGTKIPKNPVRSARGAKQCGLDHGFIGYFCLEHNPNTLRFR
ncbi:MAG: YHYH protein [Rhodobacteraceae bacterium]|nr:YHYH protein [Paracoccaceae bacterium]